jgi:antitoxin StbD
VEFRLDRSPQLGEAFGDGAQTTAASTRWYSWSSQSRRPFMPVHGTSRWRCVTSSGRWLAASTSEARSRLPAHVRRFREQGLDAEPVILGDRRHPDAALLPYETFRLLLDVAEDVAVAQRIRENDATDNGDRTTLAEAAAEFGIDLEAL